MASQVFFNMTKPPEACKVENKATQSTRVHVALLSLPTLVMMTSVKPSRVEVETRHIPPLDQQPMQECC